MPKTAKKATAKKPQQKRTRRLEILRDNFTIPRRRVDKNGMVLVWNIELEKWQRLSPIDVREGLAHDPPVFSIDGPGGEKAPDDKPEAPPDRDDVEAALADMPESGLRGLCEQHHVTFTGSDSKENLIEKLIMAEISPAGMEDADFEGDEEADEV